MAFSPDVQVLCVYCERGADPAFWAEPFNALTNVAFLVAGAAMLARSRGDKAVALLGVVTLAIAVGSFLFHTLATRLALFADVAPIQAFIAIYFFLAMRRFFGLNALAATGTTIALLAGAVALAALFPEREPWRGLGGYLGAFLALLGVAAGMTTQGGASVKTGASLLAIAGLFALSLAFRTLDGAACVVLSTGTHPLWHTLNAVVLYALVAVLSGAPRIRPNHPVT